MQPQKMQLTEKSERLRARAVSQGTLVLEALAATILYALALKCLMGAELFAFDNLNLSEFFKISMFTVSFEAIILYHRSGIRLPRIIVGGWLGLIFMAVMILFTVFAPVMVGLVMFSAFQAIDGAVPGLGTVLMLLFTFLPVIQMVYVAILLVRKACLRHRIAAASPAIEARADDEGRWR